MKSLLVPVLRVLVFCVLATPGLSANVTVNLSSNLFCVADPAYGMHTSVYDNQNGNVNLPSRLIESGVDTLRYSGGGYADLYHWAVHKMSPWQDGSYGYVGPSTDFGNFVKLLDNAQAQAVITINFGSGQLWNGAHTQLIAPSTNAEPQEAAAWVAYANGNASLYGTPGDLVIGTDSLGNNWRTVGFWAKLRSSTQAQYQTWATADGIYDATYNLLAINRPAPVGIKYWEIGNETFGTGFYDGGQGYSVNYAVPYNGTPRQYNAALSPAVFGQQVRLFSLAMKAVDPTIKIGAVVSTPPGDYGWDADNLGRRWTPEVLAGCATNIDFIIAHWYSWAGGDNQNGSSLLSTVGSTIPGMINGTTPGQDAGTGSGLKDWITAYRPADPANVQIFITEFGYFGSVTNRSRGVVNALFAADSYSSWLRYGVANIDYLEMNKTPFLGDSTSLTRGSVFYAIQMLRRMANVGDTYVDATSSAGTLRAQAAVQQSGKLGLVLINESRTSSQTANVTVNGASLATSGIKYEFGTNNFSGTSENPISPPSSNSISGLGNSFAIVLPAYTMAVITIPILVTNTAPTLAAISSQTVNVGQTVDFTADASDTNLPPQTLTFLLLSGPSDASLNTNNGAFSWRPGVPSTDTTNAFALKVSDNGLPSMSATQSFIVTVNPLTIPSLASAGMSNNVFTLQINGDVGPDYAVQVSSNLVDWSTAVISTPPTMPFLWSDDDAGMAPAQFYRVLVGPPLP